MEVDADQRYVAPPEPTEGVERRSLTAEQRQRLEELEGVFLLQEGRARFRPVKTGITGEMDIEVLEGLQPGDVVISGPYQALRTLKEWDRVEVDEKRQAETTYRARPRR